MIGLQEMEQEKTLLRWGGLAGMLGGVLFITALVVVIVGPVGMEEPTALSGWVTRFPDIHAARIVENVIYLTALILEVSLFLALYRALRKTSLTPALVGSVLGILGLAAMMISSVPHVAHAPLSDLYHASGATAADQATLALMWQLIWGMINVTTYVGFFVVATSLVVLGVGMIGSPDFGKGLGGVTVGLGAIALFSAVMQMVDPASMIGIGSYLASLIFYFVLGWKLFSSARTA